MITLEAFKPHALTISLEGTARDIELRLLPEPSYYSEIRKNYPGANKFDIERSILQRWPRDQIGENSKYGEPWRNHFLRFMKLLLPSVTITPAFMDEMYAVELCIATRHEIVNFIGHKSAGKTAISARIACTLIAIDPDNSVAYLAAPYKNVAGYTIWAELTGCFREIEVHHKGVYPQLKSLKTEGILFFKQDDDKAGFIRLIGLDQVSKFQGTKAKDQEKGFFLLVADEIGVFPSYSFIEVIGNVTANDNFIGLTGCNFKSMMGMEGTLCDPMGKEYHDLDVERDHIWRSNYKSITLRLDGHLCPNVLEKRVIYPFLLREEKRANLEEIHTLKGAKYLEQVRSFPNTSSGEQFVLTLEQIRSGGGYDEFYTKANKDWEKVVFCDPGWGGDPCKIGCFEFGKAHVQAHDGSQQVVTIFRAVEAIQSIQVQSGVKITTEILAKISRFSKTPIMTKEGRDYSKELQMAIGVAEYLTKHNVPSRNFAFDASMRGEIVREFVAVLGTDIVPYDSVNKPTEMVMDQDGKTAADKYPNLRSEMFYTLATIVNSGQLREAGLIGDALGQICRHRVTLRGTKEAIVTKDKFKEENQGKSPDAGDVVCGGAHFARRRGFELAMNKKQAITSRLSEAFSFLSLKPRPSIKKLQSR